MMSLRLPVDENLRRLLQQEDTDGDGCITVEDRGPKRFNCVALEGQSQTVSGTYGLSNLLQELVNAQKAGQEILILEPDRLFENPVDRLTRLIRERYWQQLIRKLGGEHLLQALEDPKFPQQQAYFLYVPEKDRFAFEYYQNFMLQNPQYALRVIRLSSKITPHYVQKLNQQPGLLCLALRQDAHGELQPVRFVVPGGRFNELYGWDSYFIVLGLIADGKIDLAMEIIENLIYEIHYYGKILNANRSYYLTRSQPPFLTSMVLAVYQRLPGDGASKAWLKRAMQAAIREYHTVWMNPAHLTPTGLSRYFDEGTGMPPETESGHFDHLLATFARYRGLELATFIDSYNRGKISEPELDEFFEHDRAMRESGYDTTYRLVGRCAHLNPVDLNALLFKYEMDIAEIIKSEFDDAFPFADGSKLHSHEWYLRAQKRRALMNKYLWDEKQGMYFDFDFKRQEPVHYQSATAFYPLWANLASQGQADKIIAAALKWLDMPGGIVASTESSRGPISAERPQRQWDYPFGWAPHQVLAWQGLQNYDYPELARRLAYRWLKMIITLARDYNGLIAEKYDVVHCTHKTEAEYGNVGIHFRGAPEGGFAWTNASVQIGLQILDADRRHRLRHLAPPQNLQP